jgi:hypothetical protein
MSTFLWEETGAPGENPRLSADRRRTLFTWVSHMSKNAIVDEHVFIDFAVVNSQTH